MASSPRLAEPFVIPPMTRCECAGLSFEDVASKLREHRLTLEDLGRRTGCGQTCTACVPDLQAFLAGKR